MSYSLKKAKYFQITREIRNYFRLPFASNLLRHVVGTKQTTFRVE